MYATATVLKDYSNYWVGFRSDQFTVKSKVSNIILLSKKSNNTWKQSNIENQDAVTFEQSQPEPEPEMEPEPEVRYC